MKQTRLKVKYTKNTEGKTTHITYVFTNSPNDPLELDRELLGFFSFARIRSLIVFKMFRNSQTNEYLKKVFRNRLEWTRLALQDPYLTEEERKSIEDIRRSSPKFLKDNQFTTELATVWKPLYSYLSDKHNLKPKDCREIIIDLLTGLFPDEKQLDQIIREGCFAESFEKALREVPVINEKEMTYDIYPVIKLPGK